MTIPDAGAAAAPTPSACILAIIELAKQCASHAVIPTLNNSLYCEPILNYAPMPT